MLWRSLEAVKPLCATLSHNSFTDLLDRYSRPQWVVLECVSEMTSQFDKIKKNQFQCKQLLTVCSVYIFLHINTFPLWRHRFGIRVESRAELSCTKWTQPKIILSPVWEALSGMWAIMCLLTVTFTQHSQGLLKGKGHSWVYVQCQGKISPSDLIWGLFVAVTWVLSTLVCCLLVCVWRR